MLKISQNKSILVNRLSTFNYNFQQFNLQKRPFVVSTLFGFDLKWKFELTTKNNEGFIY